jgi:omega-amidase
MDSTLTITGIQTDLVWEDKSANRAALEKKINSILEKTEVVILPETFTTGFSMNPSAFAEGMDGETINWMKRVAAEKRIILAGSMIASESDGNETNYYNRFVWMLPNGKFGKYDKRHRFAFAGEAKEFTAGTRRVIASVKGWKINLMVCYDLRFPVWSRQASENESDNDLEYDVLIYVANWPERRSTAWKTLLQARAIENQCYVVGVNRVGDDGNQIHYSGDSMVIDPLGEILYQKKEVEDIFTVTLDKAHLDNVRQKFPFWKDADEFQLR